MIVLMVLLCGPYGLAVMWVNGGYAKRTKQTVTAVWAALAVLGCAGAAMTLQPQILGLAMGAQTFKLKFGHRGANHPVKELQSGKVEITSQNHGFAVDPGTVPHDVEVTHLNLYDGTIEGLRHTSKPVFCVQYHPEASPGPHDADYLFGLFLEEMEKRV